MAKREGLGCYWGLNKKGEVDRVWYTREGTARYLSRDGYRHLIEHNRDARTEMVVVFDFSNVEHVTQSLVGTELEKRVIAKLEEIAGSKPSG